MPHSTCSLRELARITGLSTRTLARLRTKGIIQRDRRGYPMPASVHQIIRYYVRRATWCANQLVCYGIASADEIAEACKHGGLDDDLRE